MQAWGKSFSAKEINDLAGYIKTLHGTNPPNAKAPQGDLYHRGCITNNRFISCKTIKTKKWLIWKHHTRRKVSGILLLLSAKEGKRNYINPKKPKGRLYNMRTVFSMFYLAVFFTLPFIKVHGEPLLMFNILERRFIIFGMIFWPQDFFIFGIAMLTFIVFIILFTVVFGRIFCGWACPQTIFMEMVFRKIEYWIDGDSTQQKLLKKMPWNAKKIRKRTLKFVVFFLISFIIANFFLAYLISMDQLLSYIDTSCENIPTLISLMIFTSVFFFVYWWFREQVCIVVCPYGRLQSVLLDQNSILVAYDYKRGEPRGKVAKKNAEEKIEVKGDCIDCSACVRVCPTGIDIRNGTQLECVNCTACIDACNAIMTSIDKPKGLIRYASENSIKEGVKLKFTNRIKSYTAILSLLISLLVFLTCEPYRPGCYSYAYCRHDLHFTSGWKNQQSYTI